MAHDLESQSAAAHSAAAPLPSLDPGASIHAPVSGLEVKASDGPTAPDLDRLSVRPEPVRPVKDTPFIPTIDDAPRHTAADFAPQEPSGQAARLSGLWHQTRAGLHSVAGSIAARWPARKMLNDTASAPAARSTGKFPMLAASLAVAASIGAAGGAAGFAGAAKLFSAPAAPAQHPQRDLADETKALRDSVAQMRASVQKLSEHVAALRTNVEAVGKSTGSATARLNEQVNKLHDQIAKLHDGSERTEKARPAKQAAASPPQHTPTALERAASALERTAPQAQPPAPDVTGSIPAPAVPPPAPRSAEAAVPPKPGIIDAWTLRRVYDGVAVIEGRLGQIEVEPGDMIRGVGRVQDIRRQDGRWVVVTSRGLIVSR
jgi:hypothetical protein